MPIYQSDVMRQVIKISYTILELGETLKGNPEAKQLFRATEAALKPLLAQIMKSNIEYDNITLH
jgi:hypothetical protein